MNGCINYTVIFLIFFENRFLKTGLHKKSCSRLTNLSTDQIHTFELFLHFLFIFFKLFVYFYTLRSVTTSTRSITGSDVDETTSSEDGNFYEDQQKNNSNIPRHLPPSGARLQKSKTFVARGSRRQRDCYASTNNCYGKVGMMKN